MLEFAKKMIKEKSDEAIKRGNTFPGYYSQNPDAFSKEELIMILNIFYDKSITAKNTIKNYCKNQIR